MFEKEIKFVSDFCLNKISKAGSFLTFEKLKGIEIHPAILKYISAEIDYHVYQDRQALLQKSSFDYSGAEISKYFKMIANEIKKSRRITESEISELIDKAVTFNFNFTTQPNKTLSKFVFLEGDSKTSEEIILFLDYAYYYGYLRQILLSYLEKKQLLSVTQKDFEFLLTKIDTELLPAKKTELIDIVLASISDFFNIGAVLRSQISAQAIEPYLEEKNLDEYLIRLKRAVSQMPKTKYDIDEIKKLIYTSVEPASPKVEAKNYEVPPIPDESLIIKDEVQISENLAAEIKSDVQENLQTKEFTNTETNKIELSDLELMNPDAKEPIDLSEEITIEEETETFQVDTDEFLESSGDKFIKDSSMDVQPDKDILSFLSDREVERIISSIFNEDREDFATTVETISECKNYERATEILKSLYTTNNINPYSRDAIILTNAVAKYFTIA